MPKATSPRIAVRALILQDDRLLLVNAWADAKSNLWCAPGGGVHPGTSLPANLIREVHEETGLTVAVETPALVNEFHHPPSGFHQVEVFFRCRITAGSLSHDWRDPERVVTQRRFFSRDELAGGLHRFKPGSLAAAAWGEGMIYDPLELLTR